MVFPRMDKWSNVCGFRPLTVSLTDFKCVFMLTSTPVVYHRVKEKEDLGEEEVTVLVLLVRADDKRRNVLQNLLFANSKTTERVPKIVPEHVVPFFNSIVTVSLFNFWRNLTSFIVRVYYLLYPVRKVVCVRAFNFFFL